MIYIKEMVSQELGAQTSGRQTRRHTTTLDSFKTNSLTATGNTDFFLLYIITY